MKKEFRQMEHDANAARDYRNLYRRTFIDYIDLKPPEISDLLWKIMFDKGIQRESYSLAAEDAKQLAREIGSETKITFSGTSYSAEPLKYMLIKFGGIKGVDDKHSYYKNLQNSYLSVLAGLYRYPDIIAFAKNEKRFVGDADHHWLHEKERIITSLLKNYISLSEKEKNIFTLPKCDYPTLSKEETDIIFNEINISCN